jgi:hypothetical protein
MEIGFSIGIVKLTSSIYFLDLPEYLEEGRPVNKKEMGRSMIVKFFIGEFEDADLKVQEAFMFMFGNTVARAVHETKKRLANMDLAGYAKLVSCADIAHILLVNILDVKLLENPSDKEKKERGRPPGTENIEKHWGEFKKLTSAELERRKMMGIAANKETTIVQGDEVSTLTGSNTDENRMVQSPLLDPSTTKGSLEKWYKAAIDRLNEVAPPHARARQERENPNVVVEMQDAPIDDNQCMFDELEGQIEQI